MSEAKGDLHPLENTATEAISIESIRLRSIIPLNWSAVYALIGSEETFSALKPPAAAYPFIHALASVVAHAHDERIAVSQVSVADVKLARPWMGTVSSLINRFSIRLARRFDGAIQNMGVQTVEAIGARIYEVAHVAESIDDPRTEFLSELKQMLLKLESDYPDISIEDKIGYVIAGVTDVATRGDSLNQWFNKKDYPLLSAFSPLIQGALKPYDPEDVKLVGAELVQGLDVFLRHEGIQLGDSEHYKASPSVERAIAQFFTPDKLEVLKRKIPSVLRLMKEALPQNGPQFADSIYTVAQNIVALHGQGLPDKEMAEALFR